MDFVSYENEQNYCRLIKIKTTKKERKIKKTTHTHKRLKICRDLNQRRPFWSPVAYSLSLELRYVQINI